MSTINDIYKVLAKVFSYPSDEFLNHIDELKMIVQNEKSTIVEQLNIFSSMSLIDLQTLYTTTFDLTSIHSLHMFEHVYGQSRKRGDAMVELEKFYEDEGFFLDKSNYELPDYLPIVLEFLSLQPSERIHQLTPEIINVVVLLDERLKDTPYGVFMSLLRKYCKGDIDQQFVKLSLKRRPLSKDLDALWEEKPAFYDTFSDNKGD